MRKRVRYLNYKYILDIKNKSKSSSQFFKDKTIFKSRKYRNSLYMCDVLEEMKRVFINGKQVKSNDKIL